MACDHSFTYQGLVYRISDQRLAGSSARPVIYGDRYFCQKCLEIRTLNEREIGNSYEKTIHGAVPG